MTVAETHPATAPVPIPELLAPAGDWDCARAAVENGADAIYFGLERFNARMRANNFTEAALPDLMAFLHRRGVKGYVTFNTLVFANEMAEARQYLRSIIAAGVDAAIVQDVGICRVIREMSPDFPIHASTQMTVTSAGGVEFARELGCNLVVLARECSLKEIALIQAAQTNPQTAVQRPSLPLEVFVHGALCVAYSGQCLTSEALGGRSANRGECAQACRMPYELISDGKQVPLGDRRYLLSPQDLAGLDVLPELTRLGVASLKIEGRLKTPEYVANITRIYRRALDDARSATAPSTGSSPSPPEGRGGRGLEASDRARPGGSSPSPPRSGGEGRGEVVPLLDSAPAAERRGGPVQNAGSSPSPDPSRREAARGLEASDTARPGCSSPSPPRSGGQGRGEVVPLLDSLPAAERRGGPVQNAAPSPSPSRRAGGSSPGEVAPSLASPSPAVSGKGGSSSSNSARAPSDPPLARDESRYDMEMAFSRGLYTGWFGGNNNQALVHARFGKKRGVFLGRVTRIHGERIALKLEGPLKPGDGVVFDAGHPDQDEEGGRVYTLETRAGETLVGFGHGDLNWTRIQPGDRLWKTSDPELDRRLRQSFAGDQPRFLRPISAEVHGLAGKPLTVILRDELGNTVQAESSMPLAHAEKQPLGTEKLREQFGRLGGTPFELGALENHLSGDVILPVSELNRLRREAVAKLEALRAQSKRWTVNHAANDANLLPGASSPSPPRSGGEGWGEVAHSIVPVPASGLGDLAAQSAASSPSPPRSGGPRIAERSSPMGNPTGGGLGKPLGWGEVAPSLNSPSTTIGSAGSSSPSPHPVSREATDGEKTAVRTRPAASSPSPPRSGGEGWGEVAPSLDSVPAVELSDVAVQSAASSPSPPRSGGEGWGEVAHSIVPVPASGLGDLAAQSAASSPSPSRRAGGTGRGEVAPSIVSISGHSGASTAPADPELIVLARNLPQLQAALECGVQTLYCEFEDPKKYRDAVNMVRCAGGCDSPARTIWVAPPRIFKMGEDWIIKQVRSCDADGYLVRNYDHLRFFADCRRIGDYSLNVANRPAADYFKNHFGLERVTTSYDLNFTQLEALLRSAPPEWFEITLHQHMPMFHMEHCVFCAFLSTGTDYTNCGRPCDKHDVQLRDRVGAAHPLKADIGCRNTVFNSLAQTGAEYAARMIALGARHFRIEFLNETPAQVTQTITRYRQLLRGEMDGAKLWRELKLLNQLGVTRGQMGAG